MKTTRYRSNLAAWIVRGTAIGACLWPSACGSPQTVPDLSGRFYSVHTAMQASGLTQVGAVSRGRLNASQSVKLPIELTSECLTVIALGDQAVADLSLSLVDSEGKELIRDDMIGPDASIRFCPDSPGKHELVLHMEKGSGGYALSTWLGGAAARRAEGETLGPTTVEGGGTCDAPTVIVPGQTYVGNTQEGQRMEEGSCGNTAANELVYRLDLPTRQRVTIDVRAQYDSVLYVRKGDCVNPDAEVACNDDAPGSGRRSLVDEVLEPGTYFVFVDGYGEEEGAFRMTVQVRPTTSSRNECETAPLLATNSQVRGTMADRVSQVSTTCGNGGVGPDRPFRLDLATPSRVRITQRARGFLPVVHVRTVCENADSEVGCSSSGMAAGEASFTKLLEAGNYYVFADATAEGASGDFTLTTQIADAMGGGAEGDTCGSAISLARESGVVHGDTFEARDNVRVGCGTQGAGEVVYRVDLLQRARFVARLRKGNHRFGLQSTCGVTASELACGTEVNRILPAGAYWLVVEDVVRDNFGGFELGYRIDDVAAVERACASALPLVPGRPFTGTTSGAQDRFASSCVGPVDVQEGSDRVHRFSLARRSKVKLQLQAPAWEAVLSIRRSCLDPVDDLGCRHASRPGIPIELEQVLDAGTYFVVVDGRGSHSAGEYSLEFSVAEPS